MKDEIILIQDTRKGVPITAQQQDELKRLNEKQQKSLSNKLQALCETSKWRTAGRSKLVTNLSSRELSENEMEALSLGYKFSTGRDKATYVDHVNKNYKFDDSHAEKGFIQGIIACCKALADKEISSTPKRYQLALADLAKDPSIIITQADKGGVSSSWIKRSMARKCEICFLIKKPIIENVREMPKKKGKDLTRM